MLNEKLYGSTYYTRFGLYEIVSGATYKSLGECYLVNTEYPIKNTNGFGLEIISINEVEEDLQHQEEYKNKLEERLRKQREQEEREKLQEEKERKEKFEHENLYGYDANMTAMQRGKVLKVLLKQYKYQDYGVLTRKEFIIKRLQEGAYLDIKTFSNCMNHKAKNEYTTEYMLCYKDSNIFNSITKTEYDFAQYLIDNKIVA